MADFKKISDAEMELMKIIWEKKSELTANELLSLYNELEGKDLKIQTISTFLKRLTDKGLVNLRRESRTNYYSAKITYEEYKQNEAQNILNKLYKGSIKNFIAALCNKEVDKVELDELKEWFSKK